MHGTLFLYIGDYYRNRTTVTCGIYFTDNMKAIKIYLIVVSVFLCIAIGLGVYVWFTLQSIQTVSGVPQEQQTPSEGASDTEPVTSAQGETIAPIVIETASLSETQQGMLKTMGYTSETVTITATMIACAENAVGADRLKEITGGAAPSPLESMKMLPCFKK